MTANTAIEMIARFKAYFVMSPLFVSAVPAKISAKIIAANMITERIRSVSALPISSTSQY